MADLKRKMLMRERRKGAVLSSDSGEREDNLSDLMIKPSFSSSTGINTSSYTVPNTYDNHNRRNLLSITDKITKALSEFDDMYTSNAGEDALLTDVTDQIEGLESGQMKSQLKQFVNQYKDMSAEVLEANKERDEILHSLSDWFHTTQIMEAETFDLSADPDSDKGGIRDDLLNMKLAFTKLGTLENSMNRAEDAHKLEQEKKNLQSSVVAQFKDFQKAAEEKRQQEIVMEHAWKFAANEICELLSKVREEGSDVAVILAKKVDEFTKMISSKEKEVKMAKRKLKELELMESKWHEDNLFMTAEKAQLEVQMGILKKELIATRKALSAYEVLPKSRLNDEEEEVSILDKQRAKNIFLRGRPSLGGEKKDSIAIVELQSQNAELHKEMDKLHEEKATLDDKFVDMEHQMSQMENSIEQLEADKVELLHQMKQASIRPDTRRISLTQTDSHGSLFGGSVTGISIKASTRAASCCPHCGLDKSSDKSASDRSAKANSPIKTSGDSLITVAVEIKEQAPQASPPDHTKCDKLIANLEEELASAKELINNLQSEIETKNLLISTLKQEAAKEDGTRLPSDIQSTKEEVAKKPAQQSDKALAKSGKTKDKTMELLSMQEGMVDSVSTHILQTAGSTRIDDSHDWHDPADLLVTTAAHMKAKTQDLEDIDYHAGFCNRGIQTDPKHDPLSVWSKVIDKDSSWRPPLPPQGWINYDPIGMNASAFQKNQRPNSEATNLQRAMLKGAEPVMINQEATNTMSFMQKELDRMVHGVQAYIEYLEQVVDREAKMMASANRQLKKELLPNELAEMEKELDLTMKSNISSDMADLSLVEAMANVSSLNIKRGANRILSRREMTVIQDDADLQAIRNTLLPTEERLKGSIGSTGNKAITMLQETFQLFSKALHTEQEQYQHIYHMISKRQGSFMLNKLDDDGEGDNLEIKKSMSLNDLTELSGPNIDSLEEFHMEPKVKRSYSAMDVSNQQKASNASVQEGSMHQRRQSIKFSTATMPKKGLIHLTTDPLKPVLSKLPVTQSVTVKDFNMPISTFPKKKTKPVAISHQKLKARQQNLLQRNATMMTDDEKVSRRQNQPPEKSKKNTDYYQLPADYFSDYTVLELEKTADQYAEVQSRAQRTSFMEDLANPGIEKSSTGSPFNLPWLIPKEKKPSSPSTEPKAPTTLPPLDNIHFDSM